ncbi:Arm DNA-binding domain-containing protein [Pseudoalteromonas ruthenica]|uniref:Arm DNA-binding domain-containing protein n=1 Tax=Pseudoalteromonas ruthenica TaxID=151081 RepID=UPI00241F3C8B|nr:DUF3596 domain-containing protein [Pseudoalteromonas ruthenica]|tara:strand:- start:27663 stop:28838 length:1176 start_codon:yes stop_codon:yes gene_type:complete
MASINVRKETGTLYLDFRFRNQRCREQTNLNDTPANRKKLQKVLDKVEAEILLGCFDYAETFPDSKMVKKLQEQNKAIAVYSKTAPLFGDFAQVWFAEMQVQWRRSYTASVRNVVFNRLIPFFGELEVNAITKAQLLNFRSQLAGTKKRNGQLFSPSHVNRHMKIVRMILNEAADRFEFTSPYRGIKPLKIPRADIQPLTPDEISLIISHVREDFREYFTVRIFTAMRTGEIDGLKWKFVDFERRLILIRETLVSGFEEYTKTDFSQREIQMSDVVYKALLAMRQRTGKFTYVFCSEDGEPLNHNYVTKAVWYPLLRCLGIRKRVPYQMRHTGATLWLAAGENPEWIAKQMGHANTEMLFRTYSRYVPNLTRQDGSAADGLFKQIFRTEPD